MTFAFLMKKRCQGCCRRSSDRSHCKNFVSAHYILLTALLSQQAENKGAKQLTPTSISSALPKKYRKSVLQLKQTKIRTG